MTIIGKLLLATLLLVPASISHAERVKDLIDVTGVRDNPQIGRAHV